MDKRWTQAVVTAVLAAALFFEFLLRPHTPDPLLTTEEGSYLMAAGNRLARVDTVALRGRSAIAYAQAYSDTLQQKVACLRQCVAEADYFLRVHAVQDEGYGSVMNRRTGMMASIDSIERIQSVLDSLLNSPNPDIQVVTNRVASPLSKLPPRNLFVTIHGMTWLNGQIRIGWERSGRGVEIDDCGQTITGTWLKDTVVTGKIYGSDGIYEGMISNELYAEGHGVMTKPDGTFYEGRWQQGRRCGYGFEVTDSHLHAGEWKYDRFLGERMMYTSERIYGIDISRYQHGKGRRYLPIHWDKLRIRHLGKVHSQRMGSNNGYPVSFIYIKSTEGTTVRNKHFAADYRQARRHAIPCGAYHFFSTKSSGARQAAFFLRHTRFSYGDFPPVLDVEPTSHQITAMGGPDALFREVKAWLRIVHQRTGVRPVLYVSQNFVNKYLRQQTELKSQYNVWIARYGEYKPDVRLVYWQLSADGRVDGITGDVDINVFNGYANEFERFKKEQTIGSKP